MLARFAPLGFILLSFLSCSVPSRLHPWVSLAICLSVMFSQRPQKIEQDKREVGYGQSHSLAAVLTVACIPLYYNVHLPSTAPSGTHPPHKALQD